MAKVLLLAALLIIGCSSSVPTLTPLSSDAVIVAFGDSLTYGVGATTDKSYPALLAQLIQREVINAGVSGERTVQGLKRLPKVLEKYQPDLLILCHGGNDILRKTGEEQAADNFIKMIQMAQQYEIEVVLIGVPKPKLFLSEAANFYTKIATQMEIPYEDKILAQVLGKSSLKSDVVHPNAKGYQKIADAVAELLRQAEAI